MALSEKHRSRFYEHFVEHVGEEAAEAMLAQFPARDVDEPVTRGYLDVRFADVDRHFAEVDQRFAEVDQRFAEVEVRFAQVDAEFARVRTELAQMEGRLAAQISAQTDHLMTRMQWAVGMGFGFVAVLSTIVTLASS